MGGFSLVGETVLLGEFSHHISLEKLSKGDYIFEQYTGLKDSSGKEIYEGDIVMQECYVEPGYKVGESLSKVELIELKYSSTKGWGLTHVGGLDGFYLSFNHCEVVGNIHENKELL